MNQSSPRDWKLGVPRKPLPPPGPETWDGGGRLPEDESRHPDPLRKMTWLVVSLLAAMVLAFIIAFAVGHRP